MDDATVTTATNRAPTIRPHEAAHFGKLAAEWWNPKGTSAMLHRLNPVRLGFLRRAIDAHWCGDPRSRHPLAGKRALDVGCGAGLLCEPLARLGAEVMGIDAAAENIAAAKAHAAAGRFVTVAEMPTSPPSALPELVEGLPFSAPHAPGPEAKSSASTSSAWGGMGKLNYFHGELEELAVSQFDLVTSLEVLEHVADKLAFVAALAARLAPGGLMVLSTPNRTLQSRLLLVEGAEAVGAIPRGTHHWGDFITPEELEALLASAGLSMGEPQGIGFSPTKGLHLSDNLALNYIVTAMR